jgi:hypothetical protein
MTVLSKSHQRKQWEEGRGQGKKGKESSKVNTRALSGG